MAEGARPAISRRRRLSPVWAVPVVAVLIGMGMVAYTWSEQGPEIRVTFATAEGVQAGKTRVKARSVDVGVVQSVRLTPGLERVVVVAELDPGTERLLREDTRFWVVRPRVGASGISGLGTIVSGGYIELAPGEGSKGRRRFDGLEQPPVTPIGTPGLKLTLVSEQAGSVNTGDPILYNGYRVGRVETSRLDVESESVRYGAFIESPYDALVSQTTRFWNASGVALSATAEGVTLDTGSLESLVRGGVAFGRPRGVADGPPVEDGVSFELYPDFESVNDRPYRHGVHYVARFSRSVRGLRPGASVEFRGLPAGRVERLLVDEVLTGDGSAAPIPVLLRLEPGRLHRPDTAEGAEALRRAVESGIEDGLRAALSTGNLLTGSLYVSLDFHPDAEPAEPARFEGHPTLPTVPSGLENIEQRLVALLDKLNSLEVEPVLDTAGDTLRELDRAAADLRSLVESDGVRTLPGSVDASLAALERTLESVRGLAERLEARPSSLVFPGEPERDPEPRAGAP